MNITYLEGTVSGVYKQFKTPTTASLNNVVTLICSKKAVEPLEETSLTRNRSNGILQPGFLFSSNGGLPVDDIFPEESIC